MSVRYAPVQWNRYKRLYDAVLLVGVFGFIAAFLYLAPPALEHELPINPQIHTARAFGACAFAMLTLILMIGPLARLDARFLPLLYNRRHFGVFTAFVALTHAMIITDWYFSGGAIDKYRAVLVSNTSFGQISGFPFEILGVLALLCLGVLAATSHDFWLRFLTPPLWKSLHYLIYPAYVAVVAHMGLGSLQSANGPAVLWIVCICAGGVAALHLAAAWREKSLSERATDPMGDGWEYVCDASQIPDGTAKVATLSTGDRVAVFRFKDALSALSNACAHQNGPLGEGRVLRCLVTCPWHGFQYELTTGRAPAPFTERVPTFNLRLENGRVLVHNVPNPPGTYVAPTPAPDAARQEA